MARKKKKKSHKPLFWLLIFAGALTLLFNVRIPCTQAALALINEKTGGLPKDLNLTIGKVSLDLKGTLHLYGVKVGEPQVSKINYLTLDYSLSKLLTGVLDVSSLFIDSLIFEADEALPFVEKLKEKNIEDKDLLKHLSFNSIALEINSALANQGDSGKSASISDIDLELSREGDNAFKWQLQTDDIKYTNLPPIHHTKLKGLYSPKKLTVEKLNISTLSGDFLGHLTYQIPTQEVKGTINFKKFNLDKLTQSGFFGDGNVKGKVSGEVILKGNLKDTASLKSLANIKGKVSAKDLPFQKQKVVENYMPALKDVHFDKFSISKIFLEEDKIHIQGLKGIGDPLTVDGEGYITLEGKVYINLLCELTEDYYQTLQPLVKDGILTDEYDKRLFRCEIVGDLQNQKIRLNKVISQVIKTKIRKFGRGIKNLFR